MNLVQKEDTLLLDYLIDSNDFNCTIHLISDKTERGMQFVAGLGGIAATLRYKFDVSYMPDFLQNEQEELKNRANQANQFSDDSDDLDAL